MDAGMSQRTGGIVLKRFCIPLSFPLFLFLAFFSFSLSGQSLSKELKTGWYPNFPYQMEERHDEAIRITGLDVDVARKLFGEANYRINFEPMEWDSMMEGLETGDIDFVVGAYLREDRASFAHYSIPYRTERNTVYYHHHIKALEDVKSVEDLLDVLEEVPLRVAVNKRFAYASSEYAELINNPPEHLQFVTARNSKESLEFVATGEADFFVSNPIVMDYLLAENGSSNVIRKATFDLGQTPVHIMYSKENITKEEVDLFDERLAEMIENGYIRSLHIRNILPVYLSITTGQFWFTLLNYLGIIAFCTSGVILARKERYNFFGALLLATMPAIGGGVLRDLILGADQVFVLKNPGYMLFAVGIVIIAFLAFRIYDFIQSRSGEMTRTIDLYTDKKLSGVFGKIYKLLDAWAVAAFTIIGVSIAIEMQQDPLWLWGPAMGVITASGGVLLRDIVRADFNITILKQDSYAEISILGGILYTITLVYLPLNISLQLIFYLTMLFIAALFGLRFFVLWQGYENPLQFGAIHTSPQRRLQAFTEHEARPWQLLTEYYEEDEHGNARPASQSRAEHLHNQFLYTHAKLREALDELASEPLSEKNVRRYRNCSMRLDIASSVEDILFSFFQLPLGVTVDLSGQAAELQQRLHESLKTNLETASQTISSGDDLDYRLFEGIVSQHQERFNKLRNKYSIKNQQTNDPTLNAVLQTTHKAERIIYLLGEYVKVRLGKKELNTGGASNRRAQQIHLFK